MREVGALSIAAKRKDVPWFPKLMVALVVAYALSPIDLIPDFIPVLGMLDDLLLLPLGIAIALKAIPAPVMAECRAEAEREALSGRKNWRAAAVIVCIWLLIAFLTVKAVFF